MGNPPFTATILRKLISLPGREVVALCLACSLTITLPILLTEDWYAANQSYRYPCLLVSFREQFIAGHWYPRWLPDLMGSYGYPTFVFYPPGFWFFALPVTLIISNPLTVVKIVLVALLMVGGIGAHRLTRCFCSAGIASLVTVMFYLTPDLSNLLYVRGDFAELMAMLLCPWVFYHLINLCNHIRKDNPCLGNAIWLSVSLTAVLYANPITAAWLAIAISICMTGCILDTGKPIRTMVIAAICALLALALSSSYWLPFISLGAAINTYGSNLKVFYLHAIPSWDILSFTSRREGLVLPLLAVAGFCCGFPCYFMIAVTMCFTMLMLYLLPLSTTVNDFFPVLYSLQGSERVLPVVATLQLIGIASFSAYVAGHLKGRTMHTAAIAVIGILVMAGNHHYEIRDPLNIEYFYSKQKLAFEDMTHFHEFKPIHADIIGLNARALRHDPIVFSPEGKPISDLEPYADSDIRFKVTDASRVIVNQFYFPGWQVTINGIPAEDCPAHPNQKPSYCFDKHGLIAIQLDAKSTYAIHVWYGGAPNATWRNMAVLFTTLISVLMLSRLCRVY